MKPFRTRTGKSWRIWVVSAYVVFFSAQCLLRAVQTNESWKDDVLTALRPYAAGKGTRGVVADVVRRLEAGEVDGGVWGVNLLWDAVALRKYMTLLLAGLMEWHERMGVVRAGKWKLQVLRGFKKKAAFLKQKRCLVWAGLDSTAIYIISQYIRCLSPEQALLSIVIATVCYNSWRYLDAIFGAAGPPWPLTALSMASIHARARERHSWIKLSPVGGLTGSGRLSLGALSGELRLQQRGGNNTEHYHCFLSFLYCEYVSDRISKALQDLRNCALLPTAAERNEETKRILQKHFLLHGLTLEQVARLVAHVVPQVYDPAIASFVGERAVMGLQKLVLKQCRSQVDRSPGPCHAALAEKCAVEFPAFAVGVLGEDAWAFLRASMPPASAMARLTLAHLQLHEHGACEFVKNEDSELRLSKGLRGQPTPDDEFRLWTFQAYPFLEENAA